MTAEILTHPWDYRVEPFQIIDNLTYVGNADVSSHLIDTGDGLILLDTAYPQTVYLLLDSIRRMGFDPKDIKIILHSHGHYDHFGGTRAIVELTGAETALGKDDVFILTERPELTWAPEYGVEFYEFFDVDRPLSGGDVVSLGNVNVECMHAPGHTPGNMAYFFTLPHRGKDYTVGIHGGPGLNTLQADYMETYGIPGTWRDDYGTSLARLKERQVDVFIGAHPNQNNTFGKRERMTEEDNPFIDPTSWGKFLANLQVAYSAL